MIMSFINDLPHIKIIQDIAKDKHKVYLVGGYLRDRALKKDSADLDFAVDHDAISLAKAFGRRIKGAFVLLDDEHGSARVVRKENGRVWTFDFTDFRGATIKADLSRRDFTVNALCVALMDGKDHSSLAARKDIKAKVIRMSGPKAFADDPLRLLRAFSLAAQTGFRIEAKTAAAIKKQAPLINTPAMERVREELFKILQSPRAHQTFLAMDRIGMLERIVPHITVMYRVEQGGYHHLDVWRHSLEVLRQLEGVLTDAAKDARVNIYLSEEIGGGHSRAALLKLAALLHDIGKPETKRPEKGRMTFHGHEHVGERITRLVAKRLKVSVKERYFLENVVRQHLRPGYLSNFNKPTPRMVFRYMRDTGSEAAALALLAMADQRSTRGPLTTAQKIKHHEMICRMIVAEYFKEQAKPDKVRLITGHDLIKKFKLKPSPVFANILQAVEEAQALGKVKTKEDALAVAAEHIEKGVPTGGADAHP